MRILSLFFLSLALARPLAAQPPGLALECSARQGRVLRHTDKLSFAITEPSQAFSLHLRWQSTGSADWQAAQGYPMFGLGLHRFAFGDADILGHAWALAPEFRLRLWRRGGLAADVHLGSGLGWLSRPYDALRNPQNNAIGSRLNNFTVARAQVLWSPAPRYYVAGFGELAHFSNGATRLPNYGVNLLSAGLAAGYFFQNPPPTAPRPPYRLPDRWPRWGAHLFLGAALREYQSPDGPRYPIYLGQVAALYRLRPYHHLLAGLEAEQNLAVAHFAYHIGQYGSMAEARAASQRWAAVLGYEFFFGPVGIAFQQGIYLHRPIYAGGRSYSKLCLRYYAPPIGRPATRLYVGLQLKAHRITAEYFALGLGAML